MSVVIRAAKAEIDTLPRTSWFGPEVRPTIAGEYEARTGGGHVFKRKWNGQTWLSVVTGLPSTAPLEWRGVVPGALPVHSYHSTLRADLEYGLYLLNKQITAPTLIEQHEAAGLPFA